MKSLASIIKRNSMIFYRTKGNIFFATLSVLILVVLHFLIFRSMFYDYWVDIISKLNLQASHDQVYWLVDSLMFSTVLPIGAITISLVTLGLMVADKETNALSDFLVAPIKRNELLASYLVSSFIVGFMILMGFVAFFEVYFLFTFGFGFTFKQFIELVLAIAGLLIFANVFMLLIISFLKSLQSLGAIGTILGTLLGFVSGAYIPVGQFGETLANVFSALPFLQQTVIFRQIFLLTLSDHTPLTMDMLSGDLAHNFGIQVWINDYHVVMNQILIYNIIVTLILLGILMLRFKKMKKEN